MHKMKKNKTAQKVQKTIKNIIKFFNQIHKNYTTMKTNIKKIWLVLLVFAAIMIQSCNVTRVVTNESHCYQRGDTAVTITTKTIESYNAIKN